MRTGLRSLALASALLIPLGTSAAPPTTEPTVTLLVAGLEGTSGSTVGPDGALYVTEALAGRISRVDPATGDITTFATGLPTRVVPIGGLMDIEFIGHTAYVLVTLVGPDVGGSSVVGIYRIDGPDAFTIIADIGAFSVANPPDTDFDVPTGVQYALERYRGGFLVTDGHHNRVLWVTVDGTVSEFRTFGNIVPTGLAVWGHRVYMAEAGPVPHLPEDGRVVWFSPKGTAVTEVASGAPLLVDIEFGRGRTLYALAQGIFGGGPAGAPAMPNTGSLVAVDADGSFDVVVDGLNLPTSLEIIGNAAYVVTLTGEIWKIEGISNPPYGVSAGRRH